MWLQLPLIVVVVDPSMGMLKINLLYGRMEIVALGYSIINNAAMSFNDITFD